MTRPLCECHGEPMYRNGYERGVQRWVCPVYRRAVSAARYETLDGVRYSRYLLLNRRVQALARKKRREEISGALSEP